MKKILVFAAIVIAVISTSCTDQQKVKTNVKRYLGNDAKVLEFVYNDNDTVYTFDRMVELLKQINELDDEERHYHRLAINEYRYGSISLGDRYSKECDERYETEAELWSRLKEEKPVKHIVKTATVTYRDSKGCTKTEKLVISDYNTIDGTVSMLGASVDDYHQIMKILSSKPLE